MCLPVRSTNKESLVEQKISTIQVHKTIVPQQSAFFVDNETATIITVYSTHDEVRCLMIVAAAKQQ